MEQPSVITHVYSIPTPTKPLSRWYPCRKMTATLLHGCYLRPKRHYYSSLYHSLSTLLNLERYVFPSSSYFSQHSTDKLHGGRWTRFARVCSLFFVKKCMQTPVAVEQNSEYGHLTHCCTYTTRDSTIMWVACRQLLSRVSLAFAIPRSVRFWVSSAWSTA